MTTINDTLMEETLTEVNRLKEIIKEMDEKMDAEISILKDRIGEHHSDIRNKIKSMQIKAHELRVKIYNCISELKRKTVPEGCIETMAYGFFEGSAITDDFAVKPELEKSITDEKYKGLDDEFIKKYPDVYIWHNLYWEPISNYGSKEKSEEYKIQKYDLRNRIIDQLNDVEHKRRIVLDRISELKKKTLPEGYIEVTAYGFFGERAITDDFAIKPESEESIRQEEYGGLDLEFTKKYPDIYVWKKLYWIPMSEIEKEIIRSEKSEEK